MEQGSMTNQALERAKQCLKIRDVWMQLANAWIADDYDPKYSSLQNAGAQFKHAVSRATLAEITSAKTNNDPKTLYLFRVYFNLGMRIISEKDKHEDSGELNKKPAVLAQIEATMVEEYHTPEDPGKEALDMFAAGNAGYHVWPFWREYLVSQCERMRLPRVFIPTVQLSPEKTNVEA
jgi:hypothetical protein